MVLNAEKSRDDASVKKNVSGDEIYKIQYSIKDLPASNVTIYPTQTSVERHIENVPIKSGRNEITVTDLTLFADEHSIKVEGRGDAVISDTTVDTVYNNYIPEDDDSDTQESSDTDSDSSSDDEDMKALNEEIENLRSQVSDLSERENSASTQLAALEGYGKSMSADSFDVKLVPGYLEMYQTERLRLYKEHKESRSEKTTLNILLEKKVKEKNKKINAHKKRKSKENAKKLRLAQVKKDEKRAKITKKLNQESRRPRQAYKVMIVIEGSQDEIVSLKLTYLVIQASWTPRYDLILDSTSKTGQIIYKAHFINYTFEDWTDAQIRLSTSVTTFSGLSDTVPLLTPWNVKLGKRNAWQADSLHSLQEQELKKRKGLFPVQQMQMQKGAMMQQQMMQQQVATSQPPGGGLFGQTSAANNANNYNTVYQNNNVGTFGSNVAPPPAANLFGKAASYAPAAATASFGAAAPYAPPRAAENSSLFGATNTAPSNDLMSFGESSEAQTERTRRNPFGQGTAQPGSSDSEDDDEATETSTLNPVGKAMLHSESHRNSHGMTTTYDMPGLRTIKSSSLTRRFIICKIELTDVQFSRIVVPKLRSAAFTKAKVKNSSNTTLLRGTAGLTLDGSYLGSTVIPSCQPDDSFSLSLGVDTSVTVSYSKPSRKTSSKGYINKEETTLYSRSIFLHNAKPTEITLLVFDQVPVSEDEKLKINIIAPKGLRSEGDNVKTGVPGSNVSATGDSINTVSRVGPNSGTIAARQSIVGEKSVDKWGSANATLKKDGQVAWFVKLEKGKNCRLALEYEVKCPDGDAIFSVPN